MNNSVPFNKCYYINLDRSVDRKNYMEKTLPKQGIQAERISAVDGNTIHEIIPNPYNFPDIFWNKYTLGLARTIKNIIINAIEKDIETIMIIEDDVVFEENFNQCLKDCCEQLPDDWGVVQLAVGSFKRENAVNYINRNVVQIEGTCGTFGMLINKRFYHLIINAIEQLHMPIDDVFICIQRQYKKSFAFYPGLIKPLDGIKSTVTGQECNYSQIYDYIHPPPVKNVIEEGRQNAFLIDSKSMSDSESESDICGNNSESKPKRKRCRKKKKKYK